MVCMFDGINSFNGLDVSNFVTSDVTNMAEMFSCMSDLKSLDISDFDMSNVSKGINSMFQQVTELDTLVLGNKSYNYKTNNLSGSELPQKKDDVHTSCWILENTNDPLIYSSSEEFMNNYNGSRPGMYVREKTMKLKISPEACTVKIGKGKLLTPVLGAEPLDVKDVIWKSSDSSVVKVFSNGKIQGIKQGRATITATIKNREYAATSEITVE